MRSSSTARPPCRSRSAVLASLLCLHSRPAPGPLPREADENEEGMVVESRATTPDAPRACSEKNKNAARRSSSAPASHAERRRTLYRLGSAAGEHEEASLFPAPALRPTTAVPRSPRPPVAGEEVGGQRPRSPLCTASIRISGSQNPSAVAAMASATRPVHGLDSNLRETKP
jgi:hypothetical protein